MLLSPVRAVAKPLRLNVLSVLFRFFLERQFDDITMIAFRYHGHSSKSDDGLE